MIENYNALQLIVLVVVVSIVPLMILMAFGPDLVSWYEKRKAKRKGSESDTEGLQG